ncbi:flavin reductase family protein [Gulosibacter molinativorax]|uniref:Flavin reductase n=1 Tax=Gulosibacter molinativorax TaxID=256821 RepID=A0ABT7CBR1_9MICO|nr:flavin reductase family protein [Gulosibacter molinativorax]MDJ1372239.1 flavin reductase [Gulosibacter molinativorax]QUY63478.1 FMN reductase (NADH) NtaB [Gulosibacter molinativorax]
MTQTIRPSYLKGSVSEADFRAAEQASADEFKNVFRLHPGGVALITADDGSGPVALTATSVFSISVAPPLLGFSASAISSSTPTLLSAETVVVHFLTAENLDVAKLGATSGIDRFADTSIWDRLESGEPYFHGVKTWVRGEIVSRLETAGGTLHVVRGLTTSIPNGPVDEPADPIAYVNRTWHALTPGSTLPEN